MKSYTLFAIVAFFATLAFVQGAVNKKNIKHDFSELTTLERVIFSLTRPDLYKELSAKSKAAGIASSYPIFDFFNFELPTWALQLSKSGSILLPTMQWQYYFYFCYMGICAGFLQNYDYHEPEIRNANLTKLNTKINATNIEIDFAIPDLSLVMEKFTVSDEDLVTGDIDYWRGLSLSIRNYTFQLSGNLEHVPNVGVQVSNFTMNFGVDDLRIRRENGTHVFPDGSVEDLGPVETQLAADTMEGWVYFQEGMTEFTEILLNCFLSNGRNGNPDCTALLNDKSNNINFVQQLQTLALGIARNRDAEEKTSVTEIKNDKPQPLLLPEFPFPTIGATLLDFPLMLLQLGKLFDEDNDHIGFAGFPLSYDFTRESCNSNGVCRKVHEHMTLPEYGFGGLSQNKVQVDFQPNNFSYSLKVPSAYVNGEQLQHESTDVESGFRELYLGLHLTIEDAGFGVTGDYDFVEGVGIQVTNLRITLRLGKVEMRIPQYFTISNGEESEMAEYMVDIAPQIMEMWAEVDENGVSFKRRYEERIQNEINSLLSNGQSLPMLLR